MKECMYNACTGTVMLYTCGLQLWQHMDRHTHTQCGHPRQLTNKTIMILNWLCGGNVFTYNKMHMSHVMLLLGCYGDYDVIRFRIVMVQGHPRTGSSLWIVGWMLLAAAQGEIILEL